MGGHKIGAPDAIVQDGKDLRGKWQVSGGRYGIRQSYSNRSHSQSLDELKLPELTLRPRSMSSIGRSKISSPAALSDKGAPGYGHYQPKVSGIASSLKRAKQQYPVPGLKKLLRISPTPAHRDRYDRSRSCPPNMSQTMMSQTMMSF